eukprot:57940_1
MANLMKPEIRNQKLGVNFSKLQTVFYDKEFRNNAIRTLAEQIYEHDVMKGEQWKNVIGDVWKNRKDKNRFIDKNYFSNRKYLCKMGCLRLNNRAINPNSGNKYDTCCGNCAKAIDSGKKIKDVIHEPYCEKRHYNDWRRNIRDEALKKYLLKYPLKQQMGPITIIDDGKDVEENSNSNSNNNNNNAIETNENTNENNNNNNTKNNITTTTTTS